MKVLGISGSGRRDGYSARIVKDVLAELGDSAEFLSLADKQINGCLGCLGCADDNRCVQRDDFNEVIDRALNADAVVFAGPNYHASLNAISLAFWERTFSLRHQERFPLAGKLGVAIGLDRKGGDAATSHVIRMMKSNKMAVIDAFTDPGHYQCFDCGFGHECVVGNVFPLLGLCTKDHAEENRPAEYSSNVEAKKRVAGIGKVLKSILAARE